MNIWHPLTRSELSIQPGEIITLTDPRMGLLYQDAICGHCDQWCRAGWAERVISTCETCHKILCSPVDDSVSGRRCGGQRPEYRLRCGWKQWDSDLT